MAYLSRMKNFFFRTLKDIVQIIIVNEGALTFFSYLFHVMLEDEWFMFDDDNVHPVHKDDILKLSGGGKLKKIYLFNMSFYKKIYLFNISFNAIEKFHLRSLLGQATSLSVNFSNFLPRIIIGKVLTLS